MANAYQSNYKECPSEIISTSEICQMGHFFSFFNVCQGFCWLFFVSEASQHFSERSFTSSAEAKFLLFVTKTKHFHTVQCTPPFSNLHIGPPHCPIKNNCYYILTAAKTSCSSAHAWLMLLCVDVKNIYFAYWRLNVFQNLVICCTRCCLWLRVHI